MLFIRYILQSALKDPISVRSWRQVAAVLSLNVSTQRSIHKFELEWHSYIHVPFIRFLGLSCIFWNAAPMMPQSKRHVSIFVMKTKYHMICSHNQEFGVVWTYLKIQALVTNRHRLYASKWESNVLFLMNAIIFFSLRIPMILSSNVKLNFISNIKKKHQ